jgi:membrane protease YdiL (CAAX protease family)
MILQFAWREKTARLLGNRWAAMIESAFTGLVLVPYTITPVIFVVSLISLWLRKINWRDVGMRRPRSWPLTFLLALPLGIGWPFLDIFIVEPWIESLTGVKVDLSLFEGMKANIIAYVIMLAIVWTLAAFGEELVYRGYFLNRIYDLIGRNWTALILGLIPVSVCFGYAHLYQGISGMIETGYVALGLGVLYLVSGRNLWLPILVHGLYDTVGVTLLYLGKYPGHP